MSTQRTHVTTTDGVTISATAHGQGQPLVLDRARWLTAAAGALTEFFSRPRQPV